jgi:predicted class III extradiol MEMO1 family dioxygenase
MAHADSCYPKNPAECLSWVEKALEKFDAPADMSRENPQVLIVPHIDFRVHLQSYAESYHRLLALDALPEKVILVGVGHHCPHDLSIHPYSLETPFGTLPTDRDRWEQANRSLSSPLSASPETFQGEHSLEFASLWLDSIRKLRGQGESLQILPVLCGGLFECLLRGQPPQPGEFFYDFGEWLAEEMANDPGSLIILSIDGCHVGPRFGHPFTGNRATRRAVRGWEESLWQQASGEGFGAFFAHLSTTVNPFFFDGAGALSLILQHQPRRARITDTHLWFEESDQSFVTFTGGVLEKVPS